MCLDCVKVMQKDCERIIFHIYIFNLYFDIGEIDLLHFFFNKSTCVRSEIVFRITVQTKLNLFFFYVKKQFTKHFLSKKKIVFYFY
jgi:hypothetical protein